LKREEKNKKICSKRREGREKKVMVNIPTLVERGKRKLMF